MANSATTPPGDHDEALRYWLALARAPGLGAVGAARLLARLDTPAALFDSAAASLREAGLSRATLDYLRRPDWEAVERDLDWAGSERNHVITLRDPAYPALLREIADPPPLLFVHGQPDALSALQIAIVGSRNPSAGGAQTAHDFAAHFAGVGLLITSGLALGIDAAAHEAALEAGGRTLAVTGTGLDRVYPARHRQLAHRIAENGVLVSEFPPGAPPLPAHFPRRNRLISGLSLGTLVVEAALRSGSLSTARAAMEQGREVFAIPGSIHNPLARGCHALIRQGAKLVETAEHILEELGALAAAAAPPSAAEAPTLAGAALDRDYFDLLDCMGYEPVSVDQLVSRSGLTAEQVSSMLLLLELEDYVTSGAGGRYARTQKRA